MTHLDELLSVYLDGESTHAESARIESHVRDCLRCRRRLMAFNEARSAVRSLPILDLPPELVPAAGFEHPRRRRAAWMGAVAAAVAALIAVATLTAPSPEPINLSDLSRQVGARAALDSSAGSQKVIVPPAVSE